MRHVSNTYVGVTDMVAGTMNEIQIGIASAFLWCARAIAPAPQKCRKSKPAASSSKRKKKNVKIKYGVGITGPYKTEVPVK